MLQGSCIGGHAFECQIKSRNRLDSAEKLEISHFLAEHDPNSYSYCSYVLCF